MATQQTHQTTPQERSEAEQQQFEEVTARLNAMTPEQVKEFASQLGYEPLAAALATLKTPPMEGLEKMITNGLCEGAMAFFAGLEVGRVKPELSEKIQAFIKEALPEFFEQRRPTKMRGGETLDMELDVLPALEWLRFLDGFRVAGAVERPAETTEQVREFLAEYTQAHMTVEERLSVYVLVDLALRNPTLGEQVKAALWPHVGKCFNEANWDEDINEDDQIIHDMQRMMNFWRLSTGTAEPGQEEQPTAEAEQPLDEAQQVLADAIKAGPRKKGSPPEHTEPTRQRIVDFFRTLDRKGKIAVQLYLKLHCLDGINFDNQVADDEKLIEQIDEAIDVPPGPGIIQDPDESWIAAISESCEMILQGT